MPARRPCGSEPNPPPRPGQRITGLPHERGHRAEVDAVRGNRFTEAQTVGIPKEPAASAAPALPRRRHDTGPAPFADGSRTTCAAGGSAGLGRRLDRRAPPRVGPGMTGVGAASTASRPRGLTAWPGCRDRRLEQRGRSCRARSRRKSAANPTTSPRLPGPADKDQWPRESPSEPRHPTRTGTNGSCDARFPRPPSRPSRLRLALRRHRVEGVP